MIKLNASSLAERIIIKPLVEKVTKSGIVISTDERKQAINTNQGTVYMIGPMAWYDLPEKPDVKVGDKVYYAKYGAMVLKVDGMETFLVMCNDKDILVTFTEEDSNE